LNSLQKLNSAAADLKKDEIKKETEHALLSQMANPAYRMGQVARQDRVE